MNICRGNDQAVHDLTEATKAQEKEQDQTVVEEHNEVVKDIEAVKTRLLLWENTLARPHVAEFLDNKQDECDAKALRWKDPAYKPKDFAVDQPRVLAIEDVLSDFLGQPRKIRDGLAILMGRKTYLERAYPLLLASGKVEDMPAQKNKKKKVG